MERTSPETIQNFAYPPVNPELIGRVNDIDPRELNGTDNYAFSHDLLQYGVNAVLLLHLLRKAGSMQNPTEAELNNFITRHGIKFKDEKGMDICNASLESLRDEGIFVPMQMRGNKISFFNPDNLNDIGCSSPICLGEPELVKLCNTPWKKEDFTNADLLEKGALLAKDIWTISAINFERFVSETSNLPSQKPEITAVGRELMAYYWQIIDSDPTPESFGRKWITYSVEPNQSVEDEILGLNKVFIGRFPDLFENLSRCDRTPKEIKIIQGKTRQEIAAKIIQLGFGSV